MKLLRKLGCACLVVMTMAACSATGNSISDLAPEINATWDKSTVTLRVGDVVIVSFPFKPDWSHEARVRADGMASFLLIDSVQVAGLTTAELDDRLTALYQEKMSTETNVVEISLDVPTGGGVQAGSAVDGRNVYVVGEVGRPGPVALVGRSLTLFEAIADAGGHLKHTANLRNTILVRRNAKTGKMRSWRLDADIYSWGSAPSIMLQARDVVFVPNTAIDDINIWVDQYIRLMLPFPVLPTTTSF